MSGAPRWIAAYALVVAAVLAAVTRYYHPGFGLTALIEFSPKRHDIEIPAVRAAPHIDSKSGGYDGQFYAQLAVEPLVKDPALDTALDNAPYRARRIFFSWTAYALGLGRPAWILQAYAAQNVLFWLLLGWLLCRWFPPSDARSFVLWSGCLLSHGMLMSIRYALPDGPSVLLIALAVWAIEARRPFLSAVGLGAGGLARETSLLAAGLLLRSAGVSLRSWLIVGACLVVAVLPLALWTDYLRSIYWMEAFTDSGQITTPFSGLLWKLELVFRDLSRGHEAKLALLTLASILALLVQTGIVLGALARANRRGPWVLAAAPFVLLTSVMHHSVWDGTPGAFTRVLLPLLVGANIVLARMPQPNWWLIAGANLSAIPGVLWFIV